MRRFVALVMLLGGCAAAARFADRARLARDLDDLPRPRAPAADVPWTCAHRRDCSRFAGARLRFDELRLQAGLGAPPYLVVPARDDAAARARPLVPAHFAGDDARAHAVGLERRS